MKDASYFSSFKQPYCALLFNFTQTSKNNAKNEYKYLTVFVLQKTGLTGFHLQTLHGRKYIVFRRKQRKEAKL